MTSNHFYTELARYYDRIYHYVEYDKQADFFVRLMREFNRSGNRRILDVACGTGTHADILQKKGFEVTGLDISGDMLREARKKNPDVKLVKGDMMRMNLDDRFGTIICFFNSILYSTNTDQMKRTLSCFHRHLDDRGIVIFDFVDKATGIRSRKEKYVYKSRDLELSFIPRWIYNRKGNVMELKVEFSVGGRKFHDHHVMGAFSTDELKKIGEESGFEAFVLERRFDRIEERKSNSNKSIFVCRKR